MAHSITLETLAANCTKVWLGSKQILFSYATPVAVWVLGEEGVEGYVLKDRISPTTSRHLHQFGPAEARAVSADELAWLIG